MVVYYVKFEASALHSSWEIFDKNFNIGLYGEKERMNWTGINKPWNSIVSYKIQLVIVVYHSKFQTSSLHSSWENFDGKVNIGLYGEKEWIKKEK